MQISSPILGGLFSCFLFVGFFFFFFFATLASMQDLKFPDEELNLCPLAVEVGSPNH